MRAPRPIGTAIDADRLSTWRERFEGYRYGITEARLNRWLGKFADADRDSAARLLDAIEFISAEEVHAAFRTILARLPGWHRQPRRRRGRFAFIEFATSGGESGGRMLHDFRLANNLTAAQFRPLFIGRSEIVRERFGRDDTVVFVDDFVGTGNQAVTAWRQHFQELTAEVGNVFFATVAAYRAGADEIGKCTRMTLITQRTLEFTHNLFHDSCHHFTAAEKRRILHYCELASRDHPKGYGDCALAVVLYHQCPNNSLAVLHATSQRWDPLFPRS